MSFDIFKPSDNARITVPIRFVADTLYFSSGKKSAWLSGNILMGETRIGDGRVGFFLAEELDLIQQIVDNAVIRHHQELQKHGNIPY